MQPSEESLITCLSDLTILNTRMHKGKHTLTHTPQTHTNTHMYIYTYIPFIAHHTCLNPHQNKRFIRPLCRFSFVTSPPPAIPVSSQIPNTLWSHEDRCVSRHSKINYNHRQATKSPCQPASAVCLLHALSLLLKPFVSFLYSFVVLLPCLSFTFTFYFQSSPHLSLSPLSFSLDPFRLYRFIRLPLLSIPHFVSRVLPTLYPTLLFLSFILFLRSLSPLTHPPPRATSARAKAANPIRKSVYISLYLYQIPLCLLFRLLSAQKKNGRPEIQGVTWNGEGGGGADTIEKAVLANSVSRLEEGVWGSWSVSRFHGRSLISLDSYWDHLVFRIFV